ncbi:hypothetical protein BJ875DRAFT_67442 [Amylocarpus encephaloides]|uniref:UBZ4-type domain-containing protein n=1 Tax=Amylocarpus encephaloides TaxID=45428 RepID=A0A9P8C3T9_9HELO|nr:hypothetical protein BJ875DRAFT_67442 [Amylocarpus encephaloides]
MNSSRYANRSSRGRGQGRAGFRVNPRDRDPSSVPSIQQLIVGAPVSIVLKADQPTGHEVQGMVAEVLTAGNHPRGIKVRLQDGRVGRVQRMASEADAKAASEGLSGLARNGEPRAQAPTPPRSALSHPKYGDNRLDAPDEPSSKELSLSDYVVVKTARKGKGKKKTGVPGDEAPEPINSTQQDSLVAATTKCPVCGEFEGDEAAVAHHVSEHFD